MDRDLGGTRCRLDEESVVDVGERSAAARAAAASRPSLEKSRTGEKVVIDWVSCHDGRSVLLLCRYFFRAANYNLFKSVPMEHFFYYFCCYLQR